MVLREKNHNMASDQPVQKKLRRTEDDRTTTDEPDFIHNVSENGIGTDLTALHINLPPDVNEISISLNNINEQLIAVSKENVKSSEKHEIKDAPPMENKEIGEQNLIYSLYQHNQIILNVNHNRYNVENQNLGQAISSSSIPQQFPQAIPNETRFLEPDLFDEDSEDIQNYLIRQCLCGISEATLREPFERKQITDSGGTRLLTLAEWPANKTLRFLSKLQLLFEVYLKQNNKGYICARIVDVCDTIVRNEYNLIEQIIALCNTRNSYVSFLAAKVIASFLIIAKTNVNNEWLETIINYLTLENVDFVKMNFALEVIKRVVEWKDIDIHILEESQLNSESPGPSLQTESNCTLIPYSDAESYDTSTIKGLIIKGLESKWSELTDRIQGLIMNGHCIQSRTCVLTFLALWERTISIKANLSVIDTKPFYTHLESFICLLNGNLAPIIWKQLLSLFNEVLCYGSTLALQDMLPEDTCQLAHLIVR